MAISIVEISSIGKTKDHNLCEDLFVINEDFVAVIDGATNISGRLIKGKTPGRLIAEIIQKTIKDLPCDITLEELISIINKRIQENYKRLKILNDINEYAWKTPAASLIIYSCYYEEVWQIGDCQCLIDGKHYLNEKKIDKVIAEARSIFLESELKRGKTIEDLLVNDPSKEYVLQLTRRQYDFQNDRENQYGFEVINGFDVDLSKVKRLKVPKHVESLILASDGYPYLKDNLSDTEKALDDLLAADPLCFREYKLAKGLKKGDLSFDDRTYIKIQR